jgi:glycosyltransferase involved in cell wall biosynthesis
LARIEALDLKENVNVLGPVSDSELARLYSNANLYVQPSTEEGFCMTALNAASLGLPVIGCPTGALPKLCKISGGALVPSSSHDIADAIKHFLAAGLWNPTALESAILTRERYSWLNAANQLIEIYRDLRPITV